MDILIRKGIQPICVVHFHNGTKIICDSWMSYTKSVNGILAVASVKMCVFVEIAAWSTGDVEGAWSRYQFVDLIIIYNPRFTIMFNRLSLRKTFRQSPRLSLCPPDPHSIPKKIHSTQQSIRRTCIIFGLVIITTINLKYNDCRWASASFDIDRELKVCSAFNQGSDHGSKGW